MKFVLACCALLLLVSLSYGKPLQPNPQTISLEKAFPELLSQLPDDRARQLATRFLRSISGDPSECKLIDCKDPDCGKNVTELITSKGYPCEDHYAVTSDGYRLSMQHIPYGKSGPSNMTKPSVLLQHGLLDASHSWVINQPYQSLGFILADAGYDVWLGNNRGNSYSNTNINFSTQDKEFWEFSWDEMASIDLPTQISYVLNQTGHDSLFYVGHSEGTTQAFAGFIDPDVAAKVKLFVALAPVAYVGHLSSSFIPLLADLHVDTFLEAIGWPTFLQNTCFLDNFLDEVCGFDDAVICQIGMCALMGCNPSNINATRYDIYLSLDPAGTSVQNINHWGQMYRRDNYCMYDYLRDEENRKHYGQRNPPCYDLSKMAAPVALFSGDHDDMADPTDVSHLMSSLNPSMIVYSTTYTDYEHLDFIWGENAYQDLYPEIIALFETYK